jgi:hypothetical protein
MEHQHTPKEPTKTSDPRLAQAVAKGYESSDLKLKGIFMFVGVLALTLFVAMSVVYGVMMTLAQASRDKDPLASPVTVQLPPVYAPLQPSKGFYGDEKNNHQATDYDDMLVMRQKSAEQLNAPAGTTAAGRSHMPIADAMDKALPLLLTRNVIAAGTTPVNPPGSYEGHVGDQPIPEKTPTAWSNDMNSLNNQGN